MLIRLRYFKGKTQVETAAVLGMTQVQVSRREKKDFVAPAGIAVIAIRFAEFLVKSDALTFFSEIVILVVNREKVMDNGRTFGRNLRECAPFTAQGTFADYIPELAKADPRSLGIYMVSSDGRISRAGDYHQYFTIQSIVKPILLLQALLDNGVDYVRSRVGVEATGKPFDAINYTEQTLLSEHINPMVNMGRSPCVP